MHDRWRTAVVIFALLAAAVAFIVPSPLTKVAGLMLLGFVAAELLRALTSAGG